MRHNLRPFGSRNPLPMRTPMGKNRSLRQRLIQIHRLKTTLNQRLMKARKAMPRAHQKPMVETRPPHSQAVATDSRSVWGRGVRSCFRPWSMQWVSLAVLNDPSEASTSCMLNSSTALGATAAVSVSRTLTPGKGSCIRVTIAHTAPALPYTHFLDTTAALTRRLLATRAQPRQIFSHGSNRCAGPDGRAYGGLDDHWSAVAG